jgi:uncharacterized protein
MNEAYVNEALQKKMVRVIDAIEDRKSLLIAFSGGVDSSVLARLAVESDASVLAVTANSELLGDCGLAHAKEVADEIGIEHAVFDFGILKRQEFVENTHNRCYHCKKYMVLELAEIASGSGIETIADGTNMTDLTEDRPGYAAIKEASVFTPFVDFGLEKLEIRDIARYFGLSVADVPSDSCFATRIPHGMGITAQCLSRIWRAESVLHAHGMHGVRVKIRDRDDLACVEIQPRDLERFMAVRGEVAAEFRRIGFDRTVLSRNHRL